MTDLVDFVRARLKDDAQSAQGPFGKDGGYSEYNDPGHPGHHLRVLADVDAKRELLATDDTPFCTSGCWRPDQTPKDPDSGWTVEIPHHYDCTAYYIAQVLALPYAGHPDYQEKWRP